MCHNENYKSFGLLFLLFLFCLFVMKWAINTYQTEYIERLVLLNHCSGGVVPRHFLYHSSVIFFFIFLRDWNKILMIGMFYIHFSRLCSSIIKRFFWLRIGRMKKNILHDEGSVMCGVPFPFRLIFIELLLLQLNEFELFE